MHVQSRTAIRPMPTPLSHADTRYGPMIWINHGAWVGRSFKNYGEYSAGEAELLRHLLTSDATAMDCGANIGALTIPMAQACHLVIAVEPQPLCADVLRANVAINGVCVDVVQCAVGAKAGKTWFDRDVRYRPDGLTMEGYQGHDDSSTPEPVIPGRPVVPPDNPDRYPVALAAIDDILHTRRVDLIKLDVESFETEALIGARDTLKQWRPILYVENDKEHRSADLLQELHRNGYRAYWHAVPLLNPGNFFGAAHVVQGMANVSSLNMVCLHESDARFDTSRLCECTPEAPRWSDLPIVNGTNITPAITDLPGILDQPKSENRAGGAIWP